MFRFGLILSCFLVKSHECSSLWTHLCITKYNSDNVTYPVYSLPTVSLGRFLYKSQKFLLSPDFFVGPQEPQDLATPSPCELIWNNSSQQSTFQSFQFFKYMKLTCIRKLDAKPLSEDSPPASFSFFHPLQNTLSVCSHAQQMSALG